MGREEKRYMMKQYKPTVKMLEGIVKRERKKILDFMKEQTTQWSFFLGLSTTQSEVYEQQVIPLIEDIFSREYKKAGISQTEYILNLITELSTIGARESTTVLMSYIVTESSNINKCGLELNMEMVKIFEKLLNHDDIQINKLESLYDKYLKFNLIVNVSECMPLAEVPKEALASLSDKFSAIMIVIKTWLVIKPIIPSTLDSWVNECEELSDVYKLMNLSDEVISNLEYLLHDTKTEEDLLINPTIESEELMKLLPIYKLIVLRKQNSEEKDTLNSIVANLLDIDEEDDYSDLTDEELIYSIIQTSANIRSHASMQISSIIQFSIAKNYEIIQTELEEEATDLKAKLEKSKLSLIKQKTTSAELRSKLSESNIALTKLKHKSNDNAELKALREEVIALRNQNEKLKSHINSLKSANTTSELKKEVENTQEEVPSVLEEPQEVLPSLEEMLEKINQHKITVLGGPTSFANRIKEFIPNATVIDRTSKFGQIRVGSSDYIVIYWKVLGHARVMQAEAQAKRTGAKIIMVDSTNKNLFCKQVFTQL